MSCTPEFFASLKISDQKSVFEKAKELAGYDVSIGCIYRPILPLPEKWYYLKSSLDRDFPKGDILYFNDKECNLTNYTILYNWLNGFCKCCGSDKHYWDTSDKSICYYCPSCRQETTLFVKAPHAYE